MLAPPEEREKHNQDGQADEEISAREVEQRGTPVKVVTLEDTLTEEHYILARGRGSVRHCLARSINLIWQENSHCLLCAVLDSFNLCINTMIGKAIFLIMFQA
jgi:hypothetical protein